MAAMICLIILPAPVPVHAQTGESPSFAGKTITILIPYSVGGAADIMARVMLPFMAKHFPGNPTVIINNMPGGGGLLGENWVYNAAPKDGTVIGQFSTVFTDAILQPDKAKFDLSGLRWLGGVKETTVAFVHTNLGVKNAEDLPKSGKKIFFGETGIQSPRGMFARLFMKMLGIDHKVVTGYGSSGDMRAAMLRGELNMTNDTLSGYRKAVLPMVKEGLVVPMAQEGTIKDGKVIRYPDLPDIPTYTELLVKLKGEGIRQKAEFRALELLLGTRAIQRGWVYVAGVPNQIFEAMVVAFEKFLKDPEMEKAYEKAVGLKPVTLNSTQAQQIASSVVEIVKKDREALAVLKELARKAG
jgi:tripartite-type tricarboxylate transporter receptor subunit TctC